MTVVNWTIDAFILISHSIYTDYFICLGVMLAQRLSPVCQTIDRLREVKSLSALSKPLPFHQQLAQLSQTQTHLSRCQVFVSVDRSLLKRGKINSARSEYPQRRKVQYNLPTVSTQFKTNLTLSQLNYKATKQPTLGQTVRAPQPKFQTLKSPTKAERLLHFLKTHADAPKNVQRTQQQPEQSLKVSQQQYSVNQVDEKPMTSPFEQNNSDRLNSIRLELRIGDLGSKRGQMSGINSSAASRLSQSRMISPQKRGSDSSAPGGYLRKGARARDFLLKQLSAWQNEIHSPSAGYQKPELAYIKEYDQWVPASLLENGGMARLESYLSIFKGSRQVQAQDEQALKDCKIIYL